MKTVRIQLTAEVYGAWRGKAGDELERPEPEARRLIKHGFATELPPREQEPTVKVE